MPQGDQPYGWCPHRDKLGKWQACIPCSNAALETQKKVRKAHGPNCDCSVCDYDDYWRHLGKQ